ncbi:fumarate hydratase [Acetohalobium arabaticum]|uniref:Fumarase alpha subunit n=1 Tax=Acetohalobium arabaticum (strain ATCC 49924 / DSM 5501 / Z-7288) TaxID=574087 RepID=D9QV07_ACEAZ|nr:fumarate hydratase [Acetohalobium arabaticum]ADL12066.1 fumarase alpha subunit [Acetohalobium arabaticum DSM 5501]
MSINVNEITDAVAEMCMEANFILGDDIIESYHQALEREDSPVAQEILERLIENAEIAKEEKMPICQDTGMTVVFVELGQDAEIEGGDLTEAINKGVSKGYKDGYLRKSVVDGPLERENTGDNTPAVIHTEIVPGDKLKLTVAPKGFGSENMSQIKMLKPADGVEGVKDFVVQTVKEAGPNPCPPVVVGVGIGGTFEKAAFLAKKSLLRPVGEASEEENIADLETELLEKVNELNIGPQGFGGKTTALAVNVETYPTHIAGLPVAVNINCHVTRHKERTLG